MNGQPAAVDAAAGFAATVNLDGASRLTLAVSSEGETMTTSIPLTTNTVGPGGLLAPSVLANLEQAAVTILKPPDGFTSLDNLPLTVEGSVLDKDRLTDLKVNEVEVLGQIGADHRYSVRVPGTSKAITLSFTDRQGVTQRTEVPVERVPASAPTPASPVGRTVEASEAVGVQIARVRYSAEGIGRTKRLRVVVTVKDRRGVLVRNASVSVRSVKPRCLRSPKAKRTTGLRQASFVLSAGHRAFGKRLKLVILAKPPHAKHRKAGSVRLPSRTRPATARRK